MVYIAIMFGQVTAYVQDPFFWVFMLAPIAAGIARLGYLKGFLVCLVTAFLWGLATAWLRSSRGIDLPQSFVLLGFLAVFFFSCLIYITARLAVILARGEA